MQRDKRGLNPIICGDIDYNKDELELMSAIREWQLRKGRKFPAWSEVLTILRGLGYRKSGTHLSDFIVMRYKDRHGRFHGR